jgi:hypothetical protein
MIPYRGMNQLLCDRKSVIKIARYFNDNNVGGGGCGFYYKAIVGHSKI